MKRKTLRRSVVLVILAAIATTLYFNRDKLFGNTPGEELVVDTGSLTFNVVSDTNIGLTPINEDFVWQETINREKKLDFPMVTDQKDAQFTVSLDADCKVVGGRLEEVIEITFDSRAPVEDLRLDLAVSNIGFSENQFTTLYPVNTLKRFELPSQSALLEAPDELTVEPVSLFPQVVGYQLEVESNQKEQPYYRHHVQMADLKYGHTYRFCISEFKEQSWVVPGEYAVVTPSCPNDEILR